MKISRFNESSIDDRLDDIKLAFLNISDENQIKFYYSKEIYKVYQGLFGYFDNHRMSNQFLVVVTLGKEVSKDVRNPEDLEEYYKFLEDESKIYKLIYESVSKIEYDGLRIKRQYAEMLICITLT